MNRLFLSLALLAAACTPASLPGPAATKQAPAAAAASASSGIYDVKLCVAGVDPASGMATFMPTDASGPNAAVAIPLGDLSGFATGDLVTIAPASRGKTGRPGVSVVEKASGTCSRYAGPGAHAHH